MTCKARFQARVHGAKLMCTIKLAISQGNESVHDNV